MTKPFDFELPLNTGAIYQGKLRISGNAWPDDNGFDYEVTAITFDGANVFGLYEYDNSMRNGFSTDVHSAVLDHCQLLWPVG